MPSRKTKSDVSPPPATPTVRGQRAGRAAGRPRTAAREQLYVPTRSDDVIESASASLSPLELYRREKERRARVQPAVSDPIAEAKREYLALLAAEAGTAKGGRPRKNAKPKAEAAEPDEDSEDESSDEEEGDADAEEADEPEE